MRTSSWEFPSQYLAFCRIWRVLLPFVCFETRLKDWFWSIWHWDKSGEAQGKERGSAFMEKHQKCAQHFIFTSHGILRSHRSCCEVRKMILSAKGVFKCFRLSRGSLVKSTQNQLQGSACCNSLAWDSNYARHKGTPVPMLSGEWVGTSSSDIASLAKPILGKQTGPTHEHGYYCMVISADSLLACNTTQETI